MSEVEVSIRGLPEWLIREYLSEMGASADGDEAAPRMAAERWAASWSSRRVSIAGSSLALTQFDMCFSGEPDAVADARERFLKKAQRGGG